MTIDTPEFRLKLPFLLPDHKENWDELVSYINTWGAAQREEGRREEIAMAKLVVEQKNAQIAVLEEQLAAKASAVPEHFEIEKVGFGNLISHTSGLMCKAYENAADSVYEKMLFILSEAMLTAAPQPQEAASEPVTATDGLPPPVLTVEIFRRGRVERHQPNKNYYDEGTMRAHVQKSEAMLAAIRYGMIGLDRYGFDGKFGSDFGGDPLGPFVKIDDVIAILQSQRQQSDTSELSG